MPLFDQRTVAQIPLALVLLGWALVLIDYYTRWQRRDEQPLPLLRHPVTLLARAARRLWRHRSLLWLVVGLGLATWLFNVFVWRRSFYVHNHVPWSVLWWGFDLNGAAGFLRNLAATVQYRFSEGLPGWRDLLPSFFLLPVLPGLALLYLWRRRPAWLAPGLQRRAGLLSVLSLGYLALSVAGAIWWPASWLMHAEPRVRLAVALTNELLDRVGMVAWTVVGWSLVWQVARRGRWSLREAVRDILRCGWLAAAAMAALTLLSLATVWLPDAVRPLSMSTYALGQALLFLLPWVLLAERRDLRGTWRALVFLWRERTADLGLFLLRYAALFLPVNLLLDLLKQACHTTGTPVIFPGALLIPLSVGLPLLMALTSALFYLELRKQLRQAVPVSVPDPQPSPASTPVLGS